MTRFSLIALASAALLTFASVDAPAAEWTGANQPGAAPTTLADLEHSPWIADGRADAPRKVYVFMDANCKYCTKLWSDARPWVESGKVQLRYLLVAVIAPTSAGKAATLMTDPDPAKRFAAYERSHAFGVVRMMAGGPHHTLDDPNLPPMTTIPPEIARTIADHERLMASLGLRGTPGIVYRAANGQLEARPGVATDDLPIVFGPL